MPGGILFASIGIIKMNLVFSCGGVDSWPFFFIACCLYPEGLTELPTHIFVFVSVRIFFPGNKKTSRLEWDKSGLWLPEWATFIEQYRTGVKFVKELSP